MIYRSSNKRKQNPFIHDKAWINQIGNFDYVDNIATWIVALIHADAKGLYNVGTEIKTMYDLALKTKPDVKQGFKPENVPSNTTMNLNKIKKCLLKN
jgi:dTDP-4-dehydrorhamnose reductase